MAIKDAVASLYDAPQHGPRPLPLFLEMAREQIYGDAHAMAQLLDGLAQFQQAPRTDQSSAMKCIDALGAVTLNRHAERAKKPDVDVVLVPSPINAPDILDMAHGRSLIAFLESKGLACGLVNWGPVSPERKAEDASCFAAQYLRPLLQHQAKPVHLIGYCLGGLLAMAAACLTEVRSLTLIASPYDFAGYGDQRRDEIAKLWSRNRAQCVSLGTAPIELIQQGFWSLDRQRVIQKYRNFSALDKDSTDRAVFIAIEDWANGGEPLPFALADQLFSNFIGDNAVKCGAWKIDGITISPAAISAPVLEIASSTDQITPLATSAGFQNRIVYSSGHVGMIVSRNAEQKCWKDIGDWLLPTVA